MRAVFKKSVLLLVVLVGALPLYAQDAEDAVVSEQTARSAEEAYAFPVAPTADGAAASEISGAPSQVFAALRLVITLILVAVAIYALVYFLKKYNTAKTGGNEYLKVLARSALSQKSSCAVISVGDAAYIIGITDENVSLLAKVEDKEVVDAMLLDAAKREVATNERSVSFRALLTKLIPSAKETESAAEKKDTGASRLREHVKRLEKLGE